MPLPCHSCALLAARPGHEGSGSLLLGPRLAEEQAGAAEPIASGRVKGDLLEQVQKRYDERAAEIARLRATVAAGCGSGPASHPLLTYWGGRPLAGLCSFGGKGIDPEHIRAFLQKNFHDAFNLSEMEQISTMLSFPDNVSD
jgi:hypothetical protein